MINNIIFDLDGTLVDSAAVCIEILNGMLADRGSERIIPADEAAAHLSRGGAHLMAALLGCECGDPEEEILEFRRRYVDRPTPQHSLFEGVRDGLVILRDLGFGLSICSNKPQNLCEKVLSDLELDFLFDAVVGGGEGLRPKPDTDLLELTLDSIGALPEHCIFVGDSELDQAVAQAFDMQFRFVAYGYADGSWDRNVIRSFDRFMDVVQSIVDENPAPRQFGALNFRAAAAR